MYINARVKGRVMRVLSDEAKAWEKDIIYHARAWKGRTGWSEQEKKTIVRLWFFWPDQRRRDTHNTLKLLLDGLVKAGIYTDDKLALPQVMDYEIDRHRPRVEIEFEVTEHVDAG
ncbi:RusA family crossover junction endodeoxyribonuclease [Cohnella sp. GCM10020058]|uniref:RusA family crossover junction endodeoxyribonuclease n=1 Tax=Cohnella sp. GCM10020058 TaxID=3317330 RepID=UPI00364141F3